MDLSIQEKTAADTKRLEWLLPLINAQGTIKLTDTVRTRSHALAMAFASGKQDREAIDMAMAMQPN